MAEHHAEPDASSNDAAAVSEVAPRAALGKAAGLGFSWLSMSIIAGKLLNFVTQLILGAILLKEEFGVFAIATSIATFLRVFNDGGVAQVLVQRGHHHFDRLVGPAFWLSMCFSVATGLLLAGLAPISASLYGEPQLVPMLLLFAISIPLSSPATIFKAKLRLDLRFQTLSWIAVGWFLIRYGGTILLAWWGFGAMSLVIPVPIVSIFEWIATGAATKITPWKSKLDVRLWPEILNSSFWVVTAAFLKGLARNGDYVVLGLLVPTGVLGQYFFGYQLTVQFALMMATNIQYVLFPVMSHLAKEPERQAKAIVRTIRLMLLLAAPSSLIVAATIESFEALFWHGKWAAAVPLMQVFSIAAPIRLIPEIVHAAMTSRGEFRRSAMLILLEGLLLMLSAWVAASLFGTALTPIAAFIAFVQMAFSVGMSLVVLNGYGVPTRDVLSASLPVWFASTSIAVLTILLNGWLFTDLSPLVRLVLETVTFSGLFLLLARSLFRRQLDELAAVVPRPLDSLVRRVLFLNQAPAAT